MKSSQHLGSFFLNSAESQFNEEEQSPADSPLNSGGTPSRKRGKCNLSSLTPIQRQQHRARQLKEAKQRQRLKQAALGDRVVTITLTAGEAALLASLTQKQRGPIEGFARRALMLGAVFAANAGAARGRKAKGNVMAAAIKGAFADTSTNAQREGA